MFPQPSIFTQLLLFTTSIVVVLFISSSTLAVQQVNWSTLTRAQLSNLDASIFTTITTEQLSQIPSESCSGFKSSQVQQLNSTACIGWTSNQIGNLNADLIPSSFTTDCFVNILPQALTSMSYKFLSNMDATVFNALSTSQVQAIPSNAFSGMNQDKLSKLSKVCSGFTSNQMVNLVNSSPRFTCSGFTSGCISKMQSSAFQGFTSACVSRLTQDALSGFSSSSQISSITPDAFSGLSSDTIQYLSSVGCSGITSPQLKSLINTSPKYTCSGLTSQCIASIPVISFSGISSQCVSKLKLSTLQGVSASQLSNFTYESFAGFNSDNLGGLTNSCSGMSAGQIQYFDNSYPAYACKGITSDCVGAIPPETLSSITQACVNKLPVGSVASFTSAQISKMAPKAFSGFTSENIASLGSACTGIGAFQLGFLDTSYPSYACKGIVGKCLASIPSKAYSGFLYGCIKQLDVQSVNSITADQMSQITANAVTGFTSDLISNLKGDSCTGITPSQLEVFNTAYPNYACKGLMRSCLSNLKISTIPLFTGNCFGQIPVDSISGFKTNAIPSFSPTSLGGITSDQLVEFYARFGVDNFVNVLDQKQLNPVRAQVILEFKKKFENNLIIASRKFSKDEVSSLTWLQLASSTVSSVKDQLTMDTIRSLQPKTIQGLLNISSSFSDDFYTAFSYVQLANLLSDTISSMTGNQIKTINPEVFKPFSNFNIYFGYINLDAVQEVTDDQFKQLLSQGANIPSFMTCPQFRSLVSNQKQFLSSSNSYQTMVTNCIGPTPISSNNPQHSKANPRTSSPVTSTNALFNVIVFLMIVMSVLI